MSAFLISFLCAISKMNTTRMDARMLEEGRVNKKIPPQVEQVEKVLKGAQGSRNSQVPIMAGGNDMTNWEIREDLLTL